MDFSTRIPIPKGANQISYESHIFSLGSCFAVNIAEKLDHYKFRNVVNPFGILFQPTAIEKFIGFAANEQRFGESDIFFHNDRWQCFDAHSEISTNDKNDFITRLNNAVSSTYLFVKKSSHVIVTLGTSWVYRHLETDRLVANCHKLPQQQFRKELLSIAEIKASLQATVAAIREINYQSTIIFTVSPVHHIKDGFPENQRSKAHLIAALHDLLEADRQLNYFPSYEIMMDELRDYRFYAEDMIHPNSTAIDYIWERFSETWIDDASTEVMTEVDAVQKAVAHRPFHPGSESHQKFLENVRKKAEGLTSRFPHMAFIV